MICIAEKDIAKFEASSAAPRPGPGALQCTGWRGQNTNVVRPEVPLRQNRVNPGDSLPEAGAGIEEGVVPLTLVSLDPEVLKIRK